MGRFDQVRANIRRAYEAGRATVRAAKEEEERRYVEAETPPADPPPPPLVSPEELVPRPLKIAGSWSWRIIVVGIVMFYLLKLMGILTIVVIPLTIALLLAGLLSPAVGRLRRLGMHRSLATAIVVVAGLAAVVGTFTLVVNAFIDGLPALRENAVQGLKEIQNWLKTGPLHLTERQLSGVLDSAQKALTDNKDKLTDLGLTTASTAAEIVSGTFLVLFALFFFLRDGRMIWRFGVSLLPSQAREPLDQAGLASWRTLVSYVRATVLVAFIDAVGIGVGLALLKVPLALPLAALVFLTAFIPIIGATLSGAVAVLVALVTNGFVTALVVLIIVIAVQQIEGHLLQPLIMGRAVAIHPLAVIVGIASGLVLGGIIGALIAVPIIAVLNTGIRYLATYRAAGEQAAADQAATDQAPASPEPAS
jgi:predicted PurR-regulated permease PerM